MNMFSMAEHLLWERRNADGGITRYYYYDEYTWIVVALVLAWLAWFLVRRYTRARALRRPPRRTDYGLLKRIAGLKSELSLTFLQPGFSANIHAVGVGLSAGGDRYCIQVFVKDANEEIWTGGGAETLPDTYRGVPVVLIEMPQAAFLSGAGPSPPDVWDKYPGGIRDYQEVIVGGISGANTNLSGQSGTIGYFCTRKSRLPRRKEVYLLSNSHVFADLRKEKVDDSDLITQPSPGEPASNRPIGALVNFSALRFDGGTDQPNHVDAALAKLWGQHRHEPLIPFIGAVKGYVVKRDVEVGEAARKFGRTTGYTEGRICSICLDIWIRYDRTGQSAYFQNQFLIEPALPKFTRFVDKGDSGSLVVDGGQNAVGLIFAGMSNALASQATSPNVQTAGSIDPAADRPQRIENYGVANPISEVLDRLKIDLLIDQTPN
jgi:hypothetical protein